jgi:hypothetical protein
MVDLWPRYLHYIVRGHRTQKLRTAFFYANFVEENQRYRVREVSSLDDYINYESIKL